MEVPSLCGRDHSYQGGLRRFSSDSIRRSRRNAHRGTSGLWGPGENGGGARAKAQQAQSPEGGTRQCSLLGNASSSRGGGYLYGGHGLPQGAALSPLVSQMINSALQMCEQVRNVLGEGKSARLHSIQHGFVVAVGIPLGFLVATPQITFSMPLCM